MSVIWFATKVILLAFLLNVLLRQSYNLIFFVGRRPVLWIVSVAILGFGTVAIAALLEWSNSLVAWASVLALAVNVIRSRNGESAAQVALIADEIYAEMGIKGGRRKYRLGLISFAVSAGLAYVLYYGEICSSSGSCVPLATLLLNG